MSKDGNPARQAQQFKFAQAAAQCLSPLRAMTYAFGTLAVALLVAPVQADINYSDDAVIFFSICLLSAFIGIFAITFNVKGKGNELDCSRYAWNIAATRCVVIGSIGLILSVLDRYFIRGVQLSADLFESREVIEQAGAGGTAAVAALLSAFSAFGVIAVWLAHSFKQKVALGIYILAWMNTCVFVWLSASLGSRSLLLACVALHFFARNFIRQWRNETLSTRALLTTITAAVGAISILVAILQQRLDLMGFSALDSIQFSGYAYTLKPSATVLSYLGTSDFLSTFGAAAYSLVLYFLHALFEFFLLFDDFKGPFTGGEQLFWLPLKISGSILPLVKSTDLESLAGLRVGIFTTFAGPFFVDFGLQAPIYISAVFAIISIPYYKIRMGDLRWIFAALQILVVIIFSPSLPLLSSAVGIYPLVAAIILVALIPHVQSNYPRRDPGSAAQTKRTTD